MNNVWLKLDRRFFGRSWFWVLWPNFSQLAKTAARSGLWEPMPFSWWGPPLLLHPPPPVLHPPFSNPPHPSIFSVFSFTEPFPLERQGIKFIGTPTPLFSMFLVYPWVPLVPNHIPPAGKPPFLFPPCFFSSLSYSIQFSSIPQFPCLYTPTISLVPFNSSIPSVPQFPSISLLSSSPRSPNSPPYSSSLTPPPPSSLFFILNTHRPSLFSPPNLYEHLLLISFPPCKMIIGSSQSVLKRMRVRRKRAGGGGDRFHQMTGNLNPICQRAAASIYCTVHCTVSEVGQNARGTKIEKKTTLYCCRRNKNTVAKKTMLYCCRLNKNSKGDHATVVVGTRIVKKTTLYCCRRNKNSKEDNALLLLSEQE